MHHTPKSLVVPLADPRTTGSVVALVRPMPAANDAPLSPAECRRVRQMLEQFDAIVKQCPMARQILDKL
jgi:hypothetical protein